MLAKLGFRKYAYDWRAEHLPTFDREVEALKRNNVELTAVWFPAALNADAKVLLAVIEKHRLTPQLWVMMGNPAGTTRAGKRLLISRVVRPLSGSVTAKVLMATVTT